MSVPFHQQVAIGSYMLRQKLKGNRRYPLVLMLEPLFQCNLACAGCGKIDYPMPILKQRLSVEDCLAAVDECGAPVVSIPGGEPLIHPGIAEIVEGIVARRKYVYLCSNALLLEKKLHLFKPSKYLSFSIHLDGLKAHHDKSVCREGVFEKAVSAIHAAKAAGHRVSVNCTVFDDHPVEDLEAFLDYTVELGIDGITLSPGFAYERAPDQQSFLNRQRTKGFFRDLLARGTRKDRSKRWKLSHSPLYLNFLAGNEQYECTPWGNPTRNVFGWQKPCYLLGEGYVDSFKELMETTDWDSYGTGAYEKCADCMAHCGYEPTAADDALKRPWKMLKLALKGIRTSGPMAPELDLSKARPAELDHHERIVAEQMDKIDKAA